MKASRQNSVSKPQTVYFTNFSWVSCICFIRYHVMCPVSSEFITQTTTDVSCWKTLTKRLTENYSAVRYVIP